MLAFQLCLLIISMMTIEAHAARQIPDDNLALPVFVSLRNGSSGTGFFLRGKQFLYLVTAKHVLFNQDTGALLSDTADLTSYREDPKITVATTMSLDLKTLNATGKIKFSSRDVTVVLIGTYTHVSKNDNPISYFSEVSSKETHLNILTGELSGLANFDNVLIANDVVIFGYPVSIGLADLPQLDYSRPLLRKGIVAGLNYSKHSIIIDCPSYPGNSGGPVIQLENDGIQRKYSVIGIVVEFIPFVATWTNNTITNSGYSVVEPIDSVLELLADDAE